MKRKRTPRDDLWDAVVAIWFDGGPLIKSHRSRVGKLVSQLMELEATPGDVKDRHANAVSLWDEPSMVTPEAVVKHWHNLKSGRKWGSGVRPKPGKYNAR